MSKKLKYTTTAKEKLLVFGLMTLKRKFQAERSEEG